MLDANFIVEACFFDEDGTLQMEATFKVVADSHGDASEKVFESVTTDAGSISLGVFKFEKENHR